MIKTKKNNFPTIALYIIIIALAVSPAFALGDGNRNLFLIGIMYLSPIILVLYIGFYKGEVLLLAFIVSIIAFPLLLHPETMRWSTVLYSIMFALTFMAYRRLLYDSYFTINRYQTLIKFLIYAYFITLLIQQFSVLIGLPIFNLSNYNPDEPWKLNSLAAEPSHSARIVALLAYSYLSLHEIIQKQKYNFRLNYKKDKWMWIAFFWTMITMGSGTAFLFMAIVLSKFISLKNIISGILVLIILIFVINFMEITAYERTFKTIEATLTLDQEKIIEADHSASFRIVPFLVLIEMVDVSSLDGWFGHGVDNVSTFLGEHLKGAFEGVSGGGLLQVWIEYGFLSFLFFVLFSFTSTFNKKDYISIVFWFMLIFMSGVNNQIIWLTIALLFTNKHFYKTLKYTS